MTLKLSYVLFCDWMLCPHPSKSVLGGPLELALGFFLYILPRSQTGLEQAREQILSQTPIKLTQNSVVKPRGLRCSQPPHCLSHQGPNYNHITSCLKNLCSQGRPHS